MSTKDRTLARYYVECDHAGITYADAETLRRAAMTLHRWSEHECNGVIERCEDEGRTDHRGRPMLKGRVYAVSNINGPGPLRYTLTADRETPAVKRIEAIVAKLYGARLEIQGDPRGWPVHIQLADGRTISPPLRY